MDATNIIIKGENVKQLIDLLDSDIKGYSLKPGDNSYVFITEKYYLRNNSQLRVCLVVSFKDEKKCVINIVAGGGSTGLLEGSDLGAEANIIRKMSKKIEKICEDNGWTIGSY